MVSFSLLCLIAIQLRSCSSPVSCDLAYTLYCRQLAQTELTPNISVSYIAHMTGALAGLSIGLCVLRQLDGSLRPRLLRWLALGVWTTFSGFALSFNLINTVTAQLLAEEEGEVLKQHLLDLGMERWQPHPKTEPSRAVEPLTLLISI